MAHEGTLQQHIEDRLEEVEDLNAQVLAALEALRGVLPQGLLLESRSAFTSLRQSERVAPFIVPPQLQPSDPPVMPPVPEPAALRCLIPGAAASHRRARERAEAQYALRLQAHARDEAAKANERDRLRVEHARCANERHAQAANWNAQVDAFEAAYARREREAVVAYNEMVLERSPYPEFGFPKKFRINYEPARGELAIDYDLPLASVVPVAAQFRYEAQRRHIAAEPRAENEVRRTYRELVASIALRTLREMFQADHALAVSVIAFTGVVETLEPAQGQRVRVPVVWVCAGRAQFARLQLDRLDPTQCLEALGARLSACPERLQPVPTPRMAAQAPEDHATASRPNDLVSLM